MGPKAGCPGEGASEKSGGSSEDDFHDYSIGEGASLLEESVMDVPLDLPGGGLRAHL
jgi:hypothetical protein